MNIQRCYYILKLVLQQSRSPRLNKGVPQESVQAPLLFDIYTHDLTATKKFAHADDLALYKQAMEGTLTQYMAALPSFLQLSTTKTMSTTFHLYNKDARCELKIFIERQTFLGLKLDRAFTFCQHGVTAQEVNDSRWDFEATSGIKMECECHSMRSTQQLSGSRQRLLFGVVEQILKFIHSSSFKNYFETPWINSGQ